MNNEEKIIRFTNQGKVYEELGSTHL